MHELFTIVYVAVVTAFGLARELNVVKYFSRRRRQRAWDVMRDKWRLEHGKKMAVVSPMILYMAGSFEACSPASYHHTSGVGCEVFFAREHPRRIIFSSMRVEHV